LLGALPQQRFGRRQVVGAEGRRRAGRNVRLARFAVQVLDDELGRRVVGVQDRARPQQARQELAAGDQRSRA